MQYMTDKSTGLLEYLCRGLGNLNCRHCFCVNFSVTYPEFWFRFLLVNIPSYALASSPELDRVCSVIQAYLLIQVVGLCWAFLVNSALSVACEWASILPLSRNVSGKNTVTLVAAFYVTYASFRVVVGFAQSVSHTALQSMKDFPEAAKILSNAGKFTLLLSPIIFIPTFLLELGLVLGDALKDVEHPFIAMLYSNFGLHYLSSQYPDIQRVVFYSLAVMIIQLWQVLLSQFPRWDLVFRQIPSVMRFFFRSSSLILSSLTTAGAFLAIYAKSSSSTRNYTSIVWLIVTVCLLGWTLWLATYMPYLLHAQGQEWAQRVTPSSLQQLAVQLRISLVTLLSAAFLVECVSSGLLQAQLDLTVATIAIPASFVLVYQLVEGAIQVRHGSRGGRL